MTSNNPDFELSIVEDDLSDLDSSQKEVANYLKSKKKGNRFAKRSDIDPSELKTYLPFVFLFNVKSDANGTLADLKVRLMGTGLTKVFGELTGESLQKSEDEDIFKRTIPVTRERMVRSVNVILAQKKAVKFQSQKFNEINTYLQSKVIMFPLSENDVDITGIFGFVELTMQGDINPS